MTITADLPLDLAPTVRAACDLVCRESASAARKARADQPRDVRIPAGPVVRASYFDGLHPSSFRRPPRSPTSSGSSLRMVMPRERSSPISAEPWRIGVALALAIVVGVPLGLLMGMNRWVRASSAFPSISIGVSAARLPAADDYLAWDRRDVQDLRCSRSPRLHRSAFLPRPACVQYRSSASMPPVRSARTVCRFHHDLLPSALPEILTGLRIAIGAGCRRWWRRN